MEDYIVMCSMYPTMTSGKVDKFLVKIGDKVKIIESKPISKKKKMDGNLNDTSSN